MTSSWLGQGLSSLKGQLTEFTKEVLTESVEEDPVDEKIQLKVAKERVQELENDLRILTYEATSLRSQNAELSESSQSLEIQMREMSDHYQAQLKAKEKEIIELKREVTGDDQKLTFSIGTSRADDFDDAFTPPESPVTSDFEMAQLQDQIKQLKAEVQHWKTVVNTSSPTTDMEALVEENRKLTDQLQESVEKQQSEILALQKHHSEQLESLRKEMKESPVKSGWDEDWTEEQDNKSEEEDGFDDPELTGQLKDLHQQHETLQKENQKLHSARKELEEAINAKRETNSELRKTVDSLKSWDITPSISKNDGEENSDSRIEELKQQLVEAEEGLATLAADHEIAIDQILNSKKSIEEELKQKSSEFDQLSSEKTEFERQIKQLKAENAELTAAYEDINTELEKEKQEAGSITSSNHELTDRLEGLKADLIEYEEKYETCKADNLKARQQLDALTQQFDRLKDDLGSAQSMSLGETKTLRSEVDRLQNELYDSLTKRDTLAKEMNSFQDIVTRFENDMTQYRAVNEKLREENDALREQIQNLPGYREIFDETEKDLSQIRQSLSEYREEHSNTEVKLQEEIKQLQEQNDQLRTRFMEMSSSEAVPDEVENLRRLNEEQRRTIEELSVAAQPTDEEDQLRPSEHHFAESPPDNDSEERLKEKMVKIEELEAMIERFRNCIDGDTFKQLTGSETEIETMILVPQHLMARSTPSQPSPSDMKDEEGGSSGDSTNGWDKLHEGHHDTEKGPSVMAGGTMSSNQLEAQLKEALAALTEKTEECEKLQKQLTENSHELHEKEDLLQQVFTELKGLEMQIVDYREREEVLRGNIQKLTVETARKDAEIDALRKDFEDSAEREQELEEQIAQRDVEYSRISSQIEENKQEEDSAARQNEIESAHRIQDLVAEKENLESQVEFLTNEGEKNQEEAAIVKSNLEATIAEKAELQSEIAEKEASIKSLEEKLSNTMNSAESEASVIQALQTEKAQMIQLVTQKHEESVRYHAEMTRIAELLASEKSATTTETERAEKFAKEIEALRKSQEESAKSSESTLSELRQENNRLSSQINDLNDQLNSTKSQQLKTDQDSSQHSRELEALRQLNKRVTGELEAERDRANHLAQQIQTMEETRLRTQKESERLRMHLMQVEENYTTEAVASEERETELRKRVKQLEQHLALNSEEVKEKGEELGNKLEDAETQLKSMAQQRDTALLELADKQEEMEKLRNSLLSLQEVLQHFQEEKDSIVSDEVERYRVKINALESEKSTLSHELAAKHDEISSKQKEWASTSELRQELTGRDSRITELDTILKAKEKEVTELKAKISQTLRIQGEKVDKDVLKNLFLSYFAAPKDKKHEVAHLLGSILSFSEEEFKKMDSTDGSWLAFLRRSGPSGPTESSITAQFVKFLEEESQKDKSDGKKAPAPGLMTIPELPDPRTGSRSSSRSATPTGAGSLLRQQMMQTSGVPTPGASGYQLPSFSPDSSYMHSSSSTSDFLKDVLGER